MKQKTKCMMCPKMTLDTLPFKQWLYHKHGLCNSGKVSKRKLNDYWLEYRCDMLDVGLLYEPASMFGLWG